MNLEDDMEVELDARLRDRLRLLCFRMTGRNPVKWLMDEINSDSVVPLDNKEIARRFTTEQRRIDREWSKA